MATKVKKLIRPMKGRMIGGVCIGLADYLGIDVTVIRIIAVVLLLPGGMPGLIPYLILWIVIPSSDK